MLRLVAYAPDGVRRFPVLRRELLIGSRSDCDICLPYTGVSQTHARLRFDGEELRIEDLGSRRGLSVGGRKVKDSSLGILDEVKVGSVTLLVEDVAPDELERSGAAATRVSPREPRFSPQAMLEHIADISNWVLADVESRRTLESLVTTLLNDFGGGALILLHGDLAGEPGTKFVTASDPRWLAAGDELLEQVHADRPDLDVGRSGELVGQLAGERAWIGYNAFLAMERSYLLLLALPRFDGSWSPVPSLRVLGDLLVLGLVHHVGWYEPILPGRSAQKDLVLAPGLVVGESAAMQHVVEQMRLATDPEVNVVLRGEHGVGKELIARSLHLSGPRRNAPFITTTCVGAAAPMLEAELFGAEIQGKDSLFRREGKLTLAHGGTLFVDRVDLMPLAVQERLVRFLRSGQVEPAGGRAATPADVRLICASAVPLEPVVARDEFRVDLAYRLSQLTLDVPSLRARREDLPLLIQAAINRFCHETGKRMQGITVKAMSALLAYDYPGNLEELDAVARELVFLCPPGRPIDVNVLPEKVRTSQIQAAGRIDSSSDLDLENLVARTELAAIREALKRAHGNKSQASRFLGLSRNGLAMKMERYGVKE